VWFVRKDLAKKAILLVIKEYIANLLSVMFVTKDLHYPDIYFDIKEPIRETDLMNVMFAKEGLQIQAIYSAIKNHIPNLMNVMFATKGFLSQRI
jgi:hypothetical protein